MCSARRTIATRWRSAPGTVSSPAPSRPAPASARPITWGPAASCCGDTIRAPRWLPVRPGTDAAVALAAAGVMIEEGWFDAAFVRDWTNGPHLVRDDDGTLL